MFLCGFMNITLLLSERAAKLIISTLEKSALQKEVKVVIERLPLVRPRETGKLLKCHRGEKHIYY